MTLITGDYLKLEVTYRHNYDGGYSKGTAVVDFNDEAYEEEWYEELFKRLDRWGRKAIEIKCICTFPDGDEYTWTKVRG